MARKTLVALASLTLAASFLAGCGTTGMMGVSQTGESSATAKSVDAQRKAPPTVEVAAGAQVDANAKVDASSYELDRARRVSSDTLYRYEQLLRDWNRAYSDYEKDRIEERMLSELTSGLNDVQRAVSSGYGYSARQVYDIADRALNRYESLRRDWQRAYSTRERRNIVNDMLVVLTNAHKDIKAVY
ncbi:hypothetical protein D3C87_1022370 [compost metagenome]